MILIESLCPNPHLGIILHILKLFGWSKVYEKSIQKIIHKEYDAIGYGPGYAPGSVL